VDWQGEWRRGEDMTMSSVESKVEYLRLLWTNRRDRASIICLLSDSFLCNYGLIGMYFLSQRRFLSELGRKPPQVAVPVAASGGGIGRDEAEMEG